MKSIRAFLPAGLFLPALTGLSAIPPDQTSWPVDLYIDLTPERDSGVINIVPDSHDHDFGHDRFHDDLDEQLGSFMKDWGMSDFTGDSRKSTRISTITS